MKYIIKDWNENILFYGEKFDSFEEAENYLNQLFDDNGWNYYDERLRYVVQAVAS